ncbi:MAG: endolytic transglycosylase MltG [Nitrospiraceae bacterium]
MTRELKRWLIRATLGVTGIIMAVCVWWMIAPMTFSSGSSEPPQVVINISQGTTFSQVATLLENRNLISNDWGFVLLGRLLWVDHKILAGEYELDAGMSPFEILSEFRNGHVKLHAVTIPEGYSVAQIAELLGEKGLADPRKFKQIARDREVIHSLKLNVPSLEGYLYPNTYHLARHTPPQQLIAVMFQALEEAFTPKLRAQAKQMNMSVHEVLTLASVIEKETSVPDERAIISAVFHNRLRGKIPLQSDPTVIYGLESFDGNLRKRDLDSPSRYNTYRYRGLPPGPIANPGIDAIRAALYPARANYLYFVSRNDGTHFFSSTLAEHNRAVDRYQRRPNHRQS